MSCPELKKQFVNEAILGGWQAAPEGWSRDYPHSPERWFSKLHKPWRAMLRQTPRLVNHFKVGADPEFVFLDIYGEARLDATYFQFKTGLAFGADQNGRLVEVRPKPSRFALEVLTSSLSAMRWLACLYAMSREYQWRAGAYVLRDGLGGHVHLGRKSAARKEEIVALDRLNDIFMGLGMYPRGEVTMRQRGDNFGQRYGLPGDIRPQSYGYEYRTFPSWLDSPWMAYLTLVCAKLSVHDTILRDIETVGMLSARRLQQTVLNFLAKYQGLDDDARIALVTLNRVGFPRFHGGDFKGRWGLNYSKETGPVTAPQIFPSAIQPSGDEMCEMFHHLTCGSALAPVVPRPNWKHEIPNGYTTAISYTTTHHVAGMGEILVDAVVSEQKCVSFAPCDGNPELRVTADLIHKAPKNWAKMLNEAAGMNVRVVVDSPMRHGQIRFSNGMRTPDRIAVARKILFSGVFPIWKASELEEGAFERWNAKEERPAGVRSRVLVEG